ncbi:MAG: RcnB family protein [Novosphingobium sp.]
MALPSVAMAEPGERQGVEDASGEMHVRAERGGGERGGGERGGWQHRAQAEVPAINPPAPQAQAQAESRGGWNRGNRGDGWSGGQQNGGGWSGRAQTQTQPVPQAQPAEQARGWNGGWQNRGTTVPQQQAGNWRGHDHDRHDARNDGRRDERWRNNDGWRGNDSNWNNNTRYGYNQNWGYQNGGYTQNWNRDWRRDNRYNWNGWRNQHRETFRLGNYYSPYRGYSYRRLSIGFSLNSLFFGSDYVIDNPWMYRLPQAYGPYRWVRYYDDAVLVNIYNGQVEDVIYDFFW